MKQLEKLPIPQRKIITKSNISKEERQALESLKTDENIIIKEADKGATTVIMNKSYYSEKMKNILSEKSNYQKINENMDKSIITKIKKTCGNTTGLTQKEKNYLTNFEYRTSSLGLPKIHKSQEIKNESIRVNVESPSIF